MNILVNSTIKGKLVNGFNALNQEYLSMYIFVIAILKIFHSYRPNSQPAQKRLGDLPPGSEIGFLGLGSAASHILNIFGGWL